MTRVLSYNIRLGGTGQVEQLSKMIIAADPDIVGLVEATDARVVEELAARLGMEFRITGRGKQERDWQVAVLSRLPILQSEVHTRPEVLTRRHILQVRVQGTDGQPLTVYVIHLTSQVHRGRESNRVRRGEVRALLSVMAAAQGTAHLAMGDFNSLAPGDSFETSKLVRSLLDQVQQATVKVSPPPWRRSIMFRLVHRLVHNKMGSALIDMIGPLYARGGIDLLLAASYVDCFRQLHQHERGYTFPADAPATRIDYIFASPELAVDLTTSEVVMESADVRGDEASDHLPVWAEFSSHI